MATSRTALSAAFVFLLAGCRAADPPRSAPPGPSRDAGAPSREGAVVAAKRYRTCVADGPLVAARGGGRTIEELYFPGRGVVANLAWELRREGDRETWRPVLNAFYGEIRNEYGPWCGPDAAPSPVEDVEVPAALAARIFEAAELRGRADDARRAAGTRLSAAGILREVPAGKRDGAATR